MSSIYTGDFWVILGEQSKCAGCEKTLIPLDAVLSKPEGHFCKACVEQEEETDG